MVITTNLYYQEIELIPRWLLLCKKHYPSYSVQIQGAPINHSLAQNGSAFLREIEATSRLIQRFEFEPERWLPGSSLCPKRCDRSENQPFRPMAVTAHRNAGRAYRQGILWTSANSLCICTRFSWSGNLFPTEPSYKFRSHTRATRISLLTGTVKSKSMKIRFSQSSIKPAPGNSDNDHLTWLIKGY